MATHLRSVPTFAPTLSQIAYGLSQQCAELGAAIPEAEEISFAFGARGLVVEMKTGRRELRESIIHKLNNEAIPDVRFERIVEGVEKGSRRRLTITAEVR